MVIKRKKIVLVGGARPNFMKIAPLYHELKKRLVNVFLINTGQHFDKAMALQFFREFKIRPHISLNPSRESVSKQMLDIMSGLEQIFTAERPDMVVVFGDVNSTLSAGLVAHKMGIFLVHVEAGLRSFNKQMPEEANRRMVDHISDILFVTEESGLKNLSRERVLGKVHFVGNIMMDTLSLFLPKIKPKKDKFYFLTMHRGENVDNKDVFHQILTALEVISKDALIYLPLHPRTEKKAHEFGFLERIKALCRVLPPLSYQDTLSYQKHAKLVLTDSGGVQEETSFLGTPCITLRTETERPITVTHGTNMIGGVTTKSILRAYSRHSLVKKKMKVKFWDGKASKRIADILLNL